MTAHRSLDAENPPGGGFSADKTDSLVWREVISKVKSSGVAVVTSSIPLLLVKEYHTFTTFQLSNICQSCQPYDFYALCYLFRPT